MKESYAMAVSLVDRILGKPSTTVIIITFIAAAVLLVYGYQKQSSFIVTLSFITVIAAVINIVRLKSINADKND